MALIIIIILIAAFVYFKLASDNPEVKKLGKNRSDQQKQALRYFFNEGIFQKKPTDAEYEAMISSRVDSLHLEDPKRALDKLGLDESQVQEIKPIYMADYVFGRDSFVKWGQDSKPRSSRYQVSWIFFGENQIYIYQYTFNTDEDGKQEKTEEYYYKDIVNFSMSSDTEETPYWDSKKKEILLKNVHSTRFRIVVPGDSLYCAMEQTSENERAIHGMKAKLREKKEA